MLQPDVGRPNMNAHRVPVIPFLTQDRVAPKAFNLVDMGGPLGVGFAYMGVEHRAKLGVASNARIKHLHDPRDLVAGHGKAGKGVEVGHGGSC